MRGKTGRRPGALPATLRSLGTVLALASLAAMIVAASAAGQNAVPGSPLQSRVLKLGGKKVIAVWGISEIGHTLAFSEAIAKHSSSPSSIDIGDVRHWRPWRVARVRRGVQPNDTRLSKRWVAWDAYDQTGDWQLYALNRATGHEYLIDSSSKEGRAPDQSLFTVVSLHGRTLVWSYFVCHKRCAKRGTGWRSIVAAMQLPSGRHRIVASTRYPCASMEPSVWGHIAVWHQEGKCEGHVGNDVMLGNLATGKTRQLTFDHRSSSATTNGRYVAWLFGGSRFDGGRVMLLNLRTGKRVVASRNCPKRPGAWCKGRIDNSAAVPTMGSGVLMWKSISFLAARDLASGREYVVLWDSTARTFSNPYATDGKRVVWDNCNFSKRLNRCIQGLGTARIP